MCLSMLFKSAGFNVHTSDNGYECFSRVKETLLSQKEKDETYDLIVLDLNMPIMNGWDTCEKITEYYRDPNRLFDVNVHERKLSI